MVAKTILAVEIQDEAFKNFQALFEKYQKMLAAMPADWAKVGKASAEDTKNIKASEKELDKSAKHLEKITKYQQLLAKASGDGLRGARETSGIFATIAKNAEKTGLQVSKWLSLKGAFGAIAGFGAAVVGGAYVASNLRRTSGGFGISAGSLQAAETNYSKWVDVQSMLQNIQAGKTDPSSPQYAALSMMAANRSKNVSDLMVEILPKLVAEFHRAGGNQSVLQGMGALSMLSYPELQELSRLNPGELARAAQGYGRDRTQFDIADQGLQKWQEFYTNIERAGKNIKTVFIDDLAPIIPALNKLVDALNAVAGWFKRDDKSVAESHETHARAGGKHYASPWESFSAWFGSQGRSIHGGSGSATAGVQSAATAGLLHQMIMAESGGNLNALSAKGAMGPLQFMPGTAAQYGLKNPNDLGQSISAWKAYMTHLLEIYAGDIRKAVAAYNWGEGNLNNDIAKHGAAWEQYLPRETRGYLAKVIVENNTGGSAVASSAQLPY